ncbi:MAG: hotdog domain-containing protein [Limnohabitans sp.]|jgi:4-hydroxybenzoyl-CoA thioesterase|nr:hotdog domain-containing protein [Limnohabitans sp.]
MNAADFTEHLVVRLPHSDAAGVIFYPRIFEMEQELFERWLELGGFHLKDMLEGRFPPTPVVHCEANYRMPIRVGDRVTAKISAVEIGRSGFALAWRFSLGATQAITLRVKRVAIDRRAGESTDLPEAFRAWLEETMSRTGSLDAST